MDPATISEVTDHIMIKKIVPFNSAIALELKHYQNIWMLYTRNDV